MVAVRPSDAAQEVIAVKEEPPPWPQVHYPRNTPMRDAVEITLESCDEKWAQGKRKGFFKDEVVEISEDDEMEEKGMAAGWAAATNSKG